MARAATVKVFILRAMCVTGGGEVECRGGRRPGKKKMYEHLLVLCIYSVEQQVRSDFPSADHPLVDEAQSSKPNGKDGGSDDLPGE